MTIFQSIQLVPLRVHIQITGELQEKTIQLCIVDGGVSYVSVLKMSGLSSQRTEPELGPGSDHRCTSGSKEAKTCGIRAMESL